MNLCANSQPSPRLPRKQTRSNVQQSKYGCFTCRARRVKCDESKPCCNRCLRTGRACDGYRVSNSNSGQKTAELFQEPREPPVNIGEVLISHVSDVLSDLATLRCSEIGLDLLSVADNEHSSTAHSIVWNDLLPRLCRSNRSLFAATAALGAAYQAYTESIAFQGATYLSASVPYNTALASLNQDLSSSLMQRCDDVLALFLASVVLAGAEALQRNLSNALKHIRGAFKIYNEFIRKGEHSRSSEDEIFKREEERNVLDTLAKELDMQTVTYMLSIPLQVPALRLSDLQTLWMDDVAVLNEPEIISILHASYSFCSTAVQYKYYPRSHIPPSMLNEQKSYIPLLEQCLDQTKRQPQLKSLHTRCLSAMIYLRSILSPYETTFDSTLTLFREIVDVAAATLLTSNVREAESAPPRFRRISSLSQPLFLTATKCRDPKIRRKAIQLLALTGKEGPWDSEILVPVAMRAVEIEEGSLLSICKSDKEDITVPEYARLHNCGMGHMSSDTGAPVDGMIIQNESIVDSQEDHRVIEFRFWRCAAIEKLVMAKSEGFHIEDGDTDYWENWDERIAI